MIPAESGCRYLGVDHSASALATAQELAWNLPCRFEQAHLPPLPEGRFEVVLLLETMLAFPYKEALADEVARVLEPGGRFAFTVEAGRRLTEQERALMPAGALRVLEVGAGLGTMVARLLDWGVVGAGEYVLLDADRQLLDCSRRWLRDWAAARGVRSDLLPDGLQVGDLRVRLVHAELGGYLVAG